MWGGFAVGGQMAHNGVEKDEVFKMLPENVKEYTQEFLMEIQDLHDNEENWDLKGISSYGKQTVEKIKKQFNLN